MSWAGLKMDQDNYFKLKVGMNYLKTSKENRRRKQQRVNTPACSKTRDSQETVKTHIQEKVENVDIRIVLLQAVILPTFILQHMGLGQLRGGDAEIHKFQ